MVYTVLIGKRVLGQGCLMVIVTPLTNQGVCWAYYGRLRERSVLFPNIQREAG
jgi:hypothetical protein